LRRVKSDRNFNIDTIVQLAILALTIRVIYSLSEFFLPKATPSELARGNPQVDQSKELPAKATRTERDPELNEFKKLPPKVRKQVLRYASKWQEALFE